MRMEQINITEIVQKYCSDKLYMFEVSDHTIKTKLFTDLLSVVMVLCSQGMTDITDKQYDYIINILSNDEITKQERYDRWFNFWNSLDMPAMAWAPVYAVCYDYIRWTLDNLESNPYSHDEFNTLLNNFLSENDFKLN